MLLQDRVILVMGVANKRSIAWAIAQALHREGAKLIFTRPTDPEEVADTAVYLMSDWSRGLTGEVLHIDSGCHVLGM